MTSFNKLAPILAAFALVAVAAAPEASAVEKTFQNDGWVDNTAAGFQGGFVSGEIGAAVFVPEATDYPVQLRTIRVIFGGGDEGVTRNMGIKVWQDNGGDSPGALLYDEQVELQSATNAMSEVDLSGAGITINEGNFRVGIAFNHAGFPGIARDDDPGSGNDFPDRNYIFADGIGWVQSSLLGVQGDWIIRVIADVPGEGGNNTGNNDPECQSDGDCGDAEICDGDVCVPAGCQDDDACADNEICSLRTGECVEVECRTDDDCAAGATCNAQFDCVEAGNNDATNNDVGDAGVLSINSIAPATGSTDTATNVIILGTGFTTGTTFRVGPTPLSGVIVQSENSVQAVVPAGITPGVYNVIANRGPDQFSLDQGFIVEGDAGGGGGGRDDGCQVPAGSVNGAVQVGLALLGLVGLIRRR